MTGPRRNTRGQSSTGSRRRSATGHSVLSKSHTRGKLESASQQRGSRARGRGRTPFCPPRRTASSHIASWHRGCRNLGCRADDVVSRSGCLTGSLPAPSASEPVHHSPAFAGEVRVYPPKTGPHLSVLRGRLRISGLAYRWRSSQPWNLLHRSELVAGTCSMRMPMAIARAVLMRNEVQAYRLDLARVESG